MGTTHQARMDSEGQRRSLETDRDTGMGETGPYTTHRMSVVSPK
jgi:hypothetical protein